MRRRKPKPPVLVATPEELRAIVAKTLRQALAAQEHEVLVALVDTVLYLRETVSAERVTTKRLRRLLFGPQSEKTAAVLPAALPAAPSAQEPSKPESPREKPKRRGHGRRPASAYTSAETVRVAHETLKAGDPCGSCRRGKLYPYTPSVLIRIVGGPPLPAERLEREQLRCGVCGVIHTARAPQDVNSGGKYDATTSATLGLLHYGAGMPFHRLARLQEVLGAPLPAGTQWGLLRDAATDMMPAFDELERQAAQAKLLHNDDTKMPVLALTGKRRAKEAPPDDPGDRTGMFTTGIVAVDGGHRIALYVTGRRHAGENLNELLHKRSSDLAPPTQMCDGLDRNLPADFATILGNCLAHGRRHFVDLVASFPDECRHVLEVLRDVFANEEETRKLGLDDAARLVHHQKCSAPLMNDLRAWMKAKLDRHEVEPNSGLGGAFAYMENHWEALTLFLRQAGAPLENNIVERALKRAIVHRKNSLFYRTLNGAHVGDVFMSLIHTAELCRVDPFAYLVALQRHARDVHEAPADWMPWSYAATLAATATAA